jgi:hypothetical protein
VEQIVSSEKFTSSATFRGDLFTLCHDKPFHDPLITAYSSLNKLSAHWFSSSLSAKDGFRKGCPQNDQTDDAAFGKVLVGLSKIWG